MKTVKINAPAKINFSLEVVGKNDNYHMLDTVVGTINLFDVITVSPRKDNKINVKTTGLSSEESILPENDNAYFAAKAFMQKFNTYGADIKIKKNIPIGGGLGGSSADIAGTLRALKEVYPEYDEIDYSGLKEIADSLGSDSGYLLTGGFARLSGKGEIVKNIECDKEFHLVLVVAEGGVNTALCFNEFDKTQEKDPEVSSNKVEGMLLSDDNDYILPGIGNDLFVAASKINPEVRKAYDEIKSLYPKAVSMSGSGSTVFGIFETEETARWAQNKLIKKFDKVFYCKTASIEKVNKYIL